MKRIKTLTKPFGFTSLRGFLRVLGILVAVAIVAGVSRAQPAHAAATDQFVVVSVPARGLDPNKGTYSVEVMKEFEALARSTDNVSLAYDWAGSTNLHPDDAPIWDELFGAICLPTEPTNASPRLDECLASADCALAGCEKRNTDGTASLDAQWKRESDPTKKAALTDQVEAIVLRTDWWLSYRAMIKSSLRMAAHLDCVPSSRSSKNHCPSTITLLQIKGGPITSVEQRNMGALINEVKSDLSTLGYAPRFEVRRFDTWQDFLESSKKAASTLSLTAEAN